MSKDVDKYDCEKFEWGVNRLHAVIVLSIAVLVGLLGGLLFANSWPNVECGLSNFDEENGFVVSCSITGWNSGDTEDGAEPSLGVFRPFTNCIDMAPSDMVDFKNTSRELIDSLFRDTESIKQTSDDLMSKIRTFQYEYLYDTSGNELQLYSGLISNRSSITNFIDGYVANNAPSQLRYVMDVALQDVVFHAQNANYVYQAKIGAYNSLVTLARRVYTQEDLDKLQDIWDKSDAVGVAMNNLKRQIASLPATPPSDVYTPVEGSSTGGGGGDIGGGGSGGSDDYNWCTKEQGDALIELITQCRDYANSCKSYLSSVQNKLDQIKEEISSGSFFRTQYTGLPETFYANGSNHNWKTFYRLGESSPAILGYDPSNILQRIELLLYGIAGVDEDEDSVTKSYDLSDFSTQKDSLDESMQGLLGNFTSDAEEHKQRAESLSDSFRSFMESFSTWRGKTALESTDAFMPSYQYSIGGETVTIPAFTVGENNTTVPLVQQFGDYFHAFCSVVFYVGGVFILWSYWSWFAQWIFRFCKWAGEILSGLFVK